MLYLELFIEFFKIGLFSLGGGLATIPFLNKLSETKGWYTIGDLTNMLAISESTPGPIGVNMATYVGFHMGSVAGALIATFGLVLPSYIVILIVARFLDRFSKSPYVTNTFEIIRPVVTGLLFVSFLTIFNTALFSLGFDIKKIILFVILLILIMKFKKHPILYIGLGAVAGILLKFN